MYAGLIAVFSLILVPLAVWPNPIEPLLPSDFSGNILVFKNGVEESFIRRGWAVRELGVDHTRDSKFRIASLTKTITAAAILKLEEEGKLSTEDSVEKYLPLSDNTIMNKRHWQRIKISDLLNHTAGVKRDFSSTHIYDYNSMKNFLSKDLGSYDILEGQSFGKFSYSNIGYSLLAEVIRVASGLDYETYLKSKIFSKLKMYNTGIYQRKKSIPSMSEGYFYDKSKKISKECCVDVAASYGAYDLYSNVEDMTKWANEILNPSGVLSKEIVNKLKRQVVSTQQGDSLYGNGFYKSYIRGVRVYWHNGVIAKGFSSLLVIIPDLKLTVVVLSNTTFWWAPTIDINFVKNYIDFYLN